MAQYSANFTTVSFATGVKTAIQVAGASTHRMRVIEWGVSFDGVTASHAPATVRLVRQTTAGTTPGATLTPVLLDPASVAVKAAAYRGVYSAEPTIGDVFETHYLTPVGGLLVRQYAMTREPIIAASGRVAIVLNTSNTVNASAYIVWEEF